MIKLDINEIIEIDGVEYIKFIKENVNDICMLRCVRNWLYEDKGIYEEKGDIKTARSIQYNIDVLDDFFDKKGDEYYKRLIKRAENDLKKKAYPRKHKRLIRLSELKFEIMSKEKEREDFYLLGTYNYSHSVPEISLRSEYLSRDSYHLLDKEGLGVLKHEMLHHYVRRNYDMFNDYHFCGDSSPIFLAYLTWFGVSIGHNCYHRFVGTELYNKVIECKTFEELEDIVFEYYFEYKNEFRKIEQEIGDTGIGNSFRFGYGDTIGFEKIKCGWLDYKDKIEIKPNVISNVFTLGSSIMPKDINRLYQRKKYSICEDNEYLTLNIKEMHDKGKVELSEKEVKILNYKCRKYTKNKI